jgi:hypothetical protein
MTLNSPYKNWHYTAACPKCGKSCALCARGDGYAYNCSHGRRGCDYWGPAADTVSEALEAHNEAVRCWEVAA